MPLVPAKCTQCGGSVQVDNTKEAAICQHCETAFIVEKAINHYNVHNTMNFAGATVVMQQSGPKVQNLVKRAWVELEGDTVSHFKEVLSICNKIANMDIENPDLWLLRLLAGNEVSSLQKLFEKQYAHIGDVSSTIEYKKAIQFNPEKRNEIQRAVEQAQHTAKKLLYDEEQKKREEQKIREDKMYFVMENPSSPYAYLRSYLGPGGDVVIPDFVKSILSRCFGGATSHSKITSLMIPDSVTYVYDHAFRGWNKNQTIFVNKKLSKKWHSQWDKECKAKIVYR